MDPDATLKGKVAEFVSRGDFGLASGKMGGGTYERAWFEEQVGTDEVTFKADVFLLRKATVAALKAGKPMTLGPSPAPGPEATPTPGPTPKGPTPESTASTRTLRIVGNVPLEVWNRLGTKILPKLRSGSDLKVGIEFSVAVSAASAESMASELRQVLQEFGLTDAVTVE